MEDRYEKCIGNLVSFKYKTKEALKRHASPYLRGLYNGGPDGQIVPPGQK